ncbi:ESPR-type extended signal peptide-containing protein [uncultured Megasphaera sp.]|uniref:ESPR-type extended signal peptide-containing protein n=1 Tax=uncultured Megasphaera sp. TaxID=165188 RepID=UPI002597E482|nr:ESPR-type extended signal peptide-containing protein [uncultured Megasphaera sp.]
MNRIFKVIWSETKHAYCVVSEIAHTHRRTSTRRTKAASLAAVFLVSVAGSAYAALTPDQQAVYDAVIQQLAQTSGKATLGKVKVDNDKETLSLGYVQLDGKHGNLYLGTKAAGNEVGTSQTQYTHGISGSNIAWGSGNVAGLALEAQTKEATVDGKKTNIITGYKRTRQADGFMVPLWNINSSGDARSYSTAIGFLNAAYGVGAFSVGQYSAAGADSAFAGGYDAIASAKQAFAFGKEVKAMGENSVAMGEKSEAWANNSFAVGNTAKAQDVGAIAMGNNATASGKSSFAAGVKSNATAYSTVALGDNAEAGGNYSVAMGHKAKATEENSSAVGAWAKATGEYSSALGASSKALGFLSTAVGGGKVKEDGDRGLSMGYGAQTTVADGVSVGSDSVASRSGNVYGYNVLGGNAYDTESIGAAYGQGKKEEIEGYDRSLAEKQPQLEAAEVAYHKAQQDLDDMFHGRSGALEFTSANQEKLEAEIARTKKVYENLQKEFDEIKAKRNTLTGAYLSSSAAVSVGNEVTGMTRQITGVAAGTKDTDAVNVAQLKALNKKVDGKKDIHFFSSNGLDSCVNYDNQGARAGYTTAIGPDAMATEENSQAFGYRAKAIGHSSIVFGVESTASGARDIAIGYGTHAVGSDNTNTSWNDTIAIGWNALSRGGSFASGSGAVAGGSGSVALGAGAYVGTKWLDDETQKAQNVNKWVLTRSFLDKGLRDELKAKFPEKFAEWEQRAEKMPAAMGSEYLEQKLRTLAMEQLPQMTSPSMKNTMKDMESSIAIGRRTKVYSASAIAIGSEAKVGENLDGAIALGNQSLSTRNAGIFGYDPTSDAKTWTDFKKAHPEAGIGAAREQEIQREMNDLSDEVAQMGPTYQAWVDKEKYPDKYLDERKAYAEAHGNTLNGNNEWVEWVLHARNEQQKLWNKGQELTNKYNNLQKELNGGANLGKGAWIGNKAALAIGNEEDGITRQITGVAAGTKDTDAVNVAQLKVLNTKVDKVAEGSVHYLSVNSSEQGAGSNYKNDGAKGVHAVAIGAYATADSAGGVSLGRDSTAKREGGLFGYNPKNGAAFVDGTAVAEYLGKTTEYDALQTEMTAKKKAVEEAKKALKENAADTTKKENLNKAYQALEAVQQKENLLLGAYRSASAYGAFSVGNEEKGITRQITGVAAGTKDTDAVNVAQLKILNTKVDKVAANSTAYTVETKENNDNTTTVTIKSNKAGDKGTAVTVATKDIHITSGTYDKTTKKLTFTTNTNTTFDVDMNDVINAAAEGSVHYLSVNSSEQGAGSNYKNDGAKAKDSIVLGVRSSSEGINGVVVGNDNKLTGTKNDQNNSVVIGTGLNVDGVHNIVVGTNYENYDQKETKVKGAHNTVIGNGNLVGYTAVKDPDDATKWKYTEVSTSGSDRNVVVGSCNTANGSSVAVGTSLEVENLGRAFGSGNKVIGSDNGGGQWGLALGSNNTVKGEMAVSVGTGTNASGDYTVSIGSEAKTNATNSIAMGYKAETVEGWSAAIGSEAQTTGTASTAVGGLSASATVDYGAAFGSYSVAQRASGVAGYLANGQTGSAWISSLGAFSVGDDVNGYSRQITGVAAGSEDTDAVNVAQLKAIEKKIGTGGTNGKDGKSAYDIWLETQTDKTKTKQDFLDSLKGKDGKDGTGADIDIKGDTGSGVSVTSNTESGKKTYTIGLSTKIKAGEVTIDGTKDKENIAVGYVKINGEKGKGTITGLSNKTWDPNHIESGRAATEDQLKAVTQGMTEISGGIAHVGAHAAALAALHPLDFNADEKLDLAAGVGNYNGANAVAVGAYYRPNERTMFSIGGSFGSGKNMVNGGVSLKVGSGSVRSMAKAVPARQLAAQQREIREQRAQIQVLQQRDKDKEAQIQALWQEIRQLKKLK